MLMVLNESILLLSDIWWYCVNSIGYLEESWYKVVVLRKKKDQI